MTMEYFLGIDTSNYTTSVALVEMPDEDKNKNKNKNKRNEFSDETVNTEKSILADANTCFCGVNPDKMNIIYNSRIILKVKEGERGLRQSDALYQHWNNLPILLESVLQVYRDRISAVIVSEKPRSVDDSYMPVFNAGLSMAKILSLSIPCKLKTTSHQDGHFVAAAYKNDLNMNNPVLFFHLSGGTMEAVLFKGAERKIVAETKDISFGQLLDRTAVAMGYPFPGGKYIDQLALEYKNAIFSKKNTTSGGLKDFKANKLSKIYIENFGVNLSGIETQVLKRVNIIKNSNKSMSGSGNQREDFAELSFEIMQRIGESLKTLILKCRSEYCGVNENIPVLMAGGVSSSEFLRCLLISDINNIYFGNKELCTDNAVGCALIGGMQ